MKAIVFFRSKGTLAAFMLVSLILMVVLQSCSEDTVDEVQFGTLTGNVVLKGENLPLSNVKISTSPVSNTVFTNSEGGFQLLDVPVGEYAVQAELAEYKTAFEAANVLEARTTTIIFELDSLSADNPAPLTPNLLFPEDNSEDIGTSTTFQWSSSKNDEDEIDYTLQLRNGESEEMMVFENLNDTTLVVDDLRIGTKYFWQVTADDGNDAIAQSALSSFITKNEIGNRFLYVRNIGGNNVIYSGDEPIGNGDDDLNQNEVQLTSTSVNSFRPVKNSTVNKIAFLRNVGADIHLFTMNTDGTNIEQVTSTVPLAGFRSEQLKFSWHNNGAKIYYSNFNKLYSINQDGSGIELVYQTNENIFITEMAVNDSNGLVALKTNDLEGYNARITVVDLAAGTEEYVVISDMQGALGGLDYAPDGTKILFTRDVSEAENIDYRQFDSKIFEYELSSDTITEIETSKDEGTNDLDVKYAPDGGAIIFVNTSNDGVSERRIYRITPSENERKEALFLNAYMPNWE